MSKTHDVNSSFEEGDIDSDLACMPGKCIDDENLGIPEPTKLVDKFDICAKMSDSMQVYLRVRPVSMRSETTILVESDTSIVTNAPESSKRAQHTQKERHYIFSRVFAQSSKQSDVFQHVVVPLLNRFYAGENAVLFAYGMTNAGKTHTIQGSPTEPGIFPTLANEILTKVGSSSDSVVQISMLEIYQEKLFDLLSKKKEKLSIRDANGRIEVAKLSSHPLSSAEDTKKYLDSAANARYG